MHRGKENPFHVLANLGIHYSNGKKKITFHGVMERIGKVKSKGILILLRSLSIQKTVGCYHFHVHEQRSWLYVRYLQYKLVCPLLPNSETVGCTVVCYPFVLSTEKSINDRPLNNTILQNMENGD